MVQTFNPAPKCDRRKLSEADEKRFESVQSLHEHLLSPVHVDDVGAVTQVGKGDDATTAPLIPPVGFQNTRNTYEKLKTKKNVV